MDLNLTKNFKYGKKLGPLQTHGPLGMHGRVWV